MNDETSPPTEFAMTSGRMFVDRSVLDSAFEAYWLGLQRYLIINGMSSSAPFREDDVRPDHVVTS